MKEHPGDCGFNPWLGRSLEEGHDNPFQYSCLEKPGQRNLVGYSPQGGKGLDMTEATQHNACSLMKARETISKKRG